MDYISPVHPIPGSEPPRPVHGRLPTYQNYEALPDGAECKLEIEALLEHEIWKSAPFEQEKIILIQRTEEGYLVTTTSYIVPFGIEIAPNPYLGPGRITMILLENEIKNRSPTPGEGLSAVDLLTFLRTNPNMDWANPYPILEVHCTESEITLITFVEERVIPL